MTFRKEHLKHTVKGGPACQGGREGGNLRTGEHLTTPAGEFLALPVERQCDRCRSSKLFAFLERQAAKKLAA